MNIAENIGKHLKLVEAIVKHRDGLGTGVRSLDDAVAKIQEKIANATADPNVTHVDISGDIDALRSKTQALATLSCDDPADVLQPARQKVVSPNQPDKITNAAGQRISPTTAPAPAKTT